jgi:hypothetical protein
MRSSPHAPTPTLPRRDRVVLLVIGLVFNGLAACFVARPGYMDAHYYFGGALQLARGQGFNEPYVWNYLDSPTGLPRPSHLYWMPLTSLVAAPFLFFAERLSDTALPNDALFRVAQMPFVGLASLLPLLAYGIAFLTTRRRFHAFAAALLTLFSGFYAVFWTNTDSFALYGLTGGGALLAAALAVHGPSSGPLHAGVGWRWAFVAGLCAGLAHLTRADAPLMLLVVLFWLGRNPRGGAGVPFSRQSSTLLLVVLGYLLVMLPWFTRNLFVSGSPLAPGGSRALWLTEYNDLFTYPAETLTPTRYLAAGWGTILASKGSALLTNLGTLVGAQGAVVAFPFILIGLWKLRRHPLYTPAIIYALVLFAVMTLVFTFPGARGGLFHSGAALLPFFFPAAVVGLEAAVEAAARRLPHWQPDRSKPVFTGLLVVFAAGLSLVIFQMRVVGEDWRRPKFAQADAVYAEIGAWLQQAGVSASVVAVNNPPAFYYFTGYPSIVVPNGGPDALLQAASAFGARWVVLDVNYPAGLAALYASPISEPRLKLRATFDAASQPVYLFEVDLAR